MPPTTQLPSPPARKLLAAMRRAPLATGRVLELGCGLGAHLCHLGPGSVGLDRDPERVAMLRERGLDARVVDLDRPGWSEGLTDFDAVWAADLFMHLETPEVLLSELTNPLRDGGVAVIAEWVWPERGKLRQFLARRVPGGRAVWDSPEHLRRYTKDELTAGLANAGLRIEQCYVHSFRSALMGRLVSPFWPPRTWIARAIRSAGPKP